MQLPADKQDVATAEKLIEVDVEQLSPHIPQLLEWLQDMNWPVSRPTARALARCNLELVAPIRVVLGGRDDIWKYWIALFLLDVQPDVRVALVHDIARILNNPTQGEIAEGVVEAMRDVYFLITHNDESRG